jgi:hypothetical protein
MARKDEILETFLEHEIITGKYNIAPNSLPQTVRSALSSDEPIIKAIALIVENLEAASPATDATLRNIVTQYLNESAV